MKPDAMAVEFRRRIEETHLTLRTPDAEEDRFVFELAAGEIALDQHPDRARQLLLLAEAVYTKGVGEALELAGLVAKRDDLDEASGLPRTVVWRSADQAHARLNPGVWVRFEDWVNDQFLMEDALALRFGRENGWR